MSPRQQYYGERDYLTVDGRKNQPMCKPLSKHGRGMATKGPFRTAGRLQQQSRKKIKQCGLDHMDRHSTCPVLLKKLCARSRMGSKVDGRSPPQLKDPVAELAMCRRHANRQRSGQKQNLIIFFDSSPWRKNCAPPSPQHP